jgi:hypothetical protein
MEFYTIPHYPNYEMTNIGVVRNKRTKRILKPHLEKGRYPRVSLYDIEKKKNTQEFVVTLYFLTIRPENIPPQELYPTFGRT